MIIIILKIINLITCNFLPINLLSRNFEKKSSLLKTYIGITLLVGVLAYFIPNLFQLNPILVSFIRILIIFFLYNIFFVGKFYKKSLIIVVSFLGLGIAEVASLFILNYFGINQKNIDSNNIYLFFGTMVFNLILITNFYFINKVISKKKRNGQILINKYQFIILIFQALFIILAISYIIKAEHFYRKDISIIIISIIFFILVSDFLLFKNAKINKHNELLIKDLEFIEKHNKLQMNRYKEIEFRILETRKIKHDITNHLIVLKTLIEEERTEEAREYLKKLEDKINFVEKRYCDNSTINSILKDRVAKNNNIDYDISFNGLKEINIIDEDIKLIFNYLLDISINMCKEIKEEDRRIKIRGYSEDNKLIIKVQNSCIYSFEEEILKSQKFKIDSIKEVVNKYSGEYTSFINKDKHCIEINL